MPASRQPELYAAALVPYAAASIALVLRMVARRTTKMAFVWEDYLAVVAHMVGSGFTILSICKMRWGLGQHLADIDMDIDQLKRHYFFELWIDMWFYTFSVGLSKFVILGLYWRLFSRSIIRQPIRILFVGSALWLVGRVALILLQCQPIQSFWDKSVQGTCPLTPMMSLFALSIPHIVLEIAILLCPLIEIWRLHLSTAKKIAVAAMFASGILVCASAIGTIVHTVILDRKDENLDPDLTWDGLDDQIWAVCDVNLASFATSLPLLRPVFRSFGGIFSGLKSTATPDAHRTPTYGSALTRRVRMRRHDVDSESVIEFADEGGHMARISGRAIELNDVTPNESEIDVQGGVVLGGEVGIVAAR
ncbi:hypothetical protein CC86DRAFT_124771 [Ophiobolus disseminans]|uniref:Rhodopsin domain-containing protein n=1 Tax=Ophiobolus disseminans TaxID=1469910 RepID=A0A6A6ZG28_9PLEO|nr:hypothetical protein CC86DRAFT_124771 [Ophiobolus disseminans]